LYFERLAEQAEELHRRQDWPAAENAFRRLLSLGVNTLYVQRRLAETLWRGRREKEESLQLCQNINQQRPTPETLVLEARLHRACERTEKAIKLLEAARAILAWEPCHD
jgi:predicted Zn-dependent protease